MEEKRTTPIRTRADAIQALNRISSDSAFPNTSQAAILMGGMELALHYPEWSLALVNLTGVELIRPLLIREMKAIVDANPIEEQDSWTNAL